MAKPPVDLARFDERAEFVVAHPFTAGNIRWKPGAPFDKTKVKTRTLKQLYYQRKLRPMQGHVSRKFVPGQGFRTIYEGVPFPKEEVVVTVGAPVFMAKYPGLQDWMPPIDADPYGEALPVKRKRGRPRKVA